MEHTDARESIADLALEPRRVIDLERDPTPEARALVAHVGGCAACRAELDAWRRTHEVMLEAAGTDGVGVGVGRFDRSVGADDGPAAPPASLRAAVAVLPSRSPRLLTADGTRPTVVPATGQRGRGWHLPALALVLVIGLFVGLGALTLDQVHRSGVARGQAAELAALTTSLEGVLRADGRRAIPLVGLDGAASGSAVWSADEIVVISNSLTPPGTGAEYRCWVERDGQRTPIGVMRFVDGLAYWSGPLSRYDDLSLDGAGRLGVSLEVVGKGGGGAPVLVGDLPS